MLTAVFIGIVSTVIATITYPYCPDTAACVATFELVFAACYTDITKTRSQNADKTTVSLQHRRITVPLPRYAPNAPIFNNLQFCRLAWLSKC